MNDTGVLPENRNQTINSRLPAEHLDDDGRRIRIQTFEPKPADVESLIDMYAEFEGPDRAQGIPPKGREEIRAWLARLDGYHVVSFHQAISVGHAVLVPYEPDTAELAVFVRPNYQDAGIGTSILDRILGRAREAGLSEVSLSVERSNHAAISLYRKFGFDVATERPIELEMRRQLD